MGTRHIIDVKLNGELKVHQYGQWDGYPEEHPWQIFEFKPELYHDCEVVCSH